LVDELEALDYVERQPDPADRRAKLIKLTAKGWRVTRAAREAAHAVDARLRTVLGADGLASLRASLESILEMPPPPAGKKHRASARR
jgi:DNA-binding MarR family transcriptional regulator